MWKTGSSRAGLITRCMALALIGIAAAAETRVDPSQIRDVRQVCRFSMACEGTGIDIAQVRDYLVRFELGTQADVAEDGTTTYRTWLYALTWACYPGCASVTPAYRFEPETPRLMLWHSHGGPFVGEQPCATCIGEPLASWTWDIERNEYLRE